MRMRYSKKTTPFLLLITASLFTCALALADSAVLSVDNGESSDAKNAPAQDSNFVQRTPSWHEGLWQGSFDAASDASNRAAIQLHELQFQCENYLVDMPANDETGTPARAKNPGLYSACKRREAETRKAAQDSLNIQKQQEAMSIVSKASDVAAVGAVGAVAYSELGQKSSHQASAYDSAVKIETIAGKANYAAGATDFALGAYAYMAQKNRLEEIKSTVTGSKGGVKIETNGTTANSVAAAAEAAAQAAYSHMLWGAGKMAAGAASLYLAKRTKQQADSLKSIDAQKDYEAYLAYQARMNPKAAIPQIAYNPEAVYYNSNQPTFSMPDSSATSLSTAASTNLGSSNSAFSSSGSSVAPPSAAAASGSSRSPSSIATRSGGSSGSGASKSASNADTAEAKEEGGHAKEALGNTFEMQLTGGLRSFEGGAHTDSTKDAASALGGLLGGNAPAPQQPVASGLSANEIYSDALQGTDGSEQGSMAGVNGRGSSSLFDITKQKLTKMFQVGNVGIPKNVEVK